VKRRWMFGAVNSRWELLAALPWLALIGLLAWATLSYVGAIPSR
jgi:hypothetical protein